ncbi:MAG TPA: hypothetical protein VK391_04205 [Allosphingosinicella sp.]|nr:hypothetical protein [Allosphingosinicella sp.]
MRNSVGLIFVVSVLALGACGGGEEGAGGVTAEESRQLNEAAEMLDASPDSLVASNETDLGNGEEASEEAAAEEAVTNAE